MGKRKSIRDSLNKLQPTVGRSAEEEQVLKETIEWVLELDAAGQPRPAWHEIVRTLSKDFNISVSEPTLRRRFKQAKDV